MLPTVETYLQSPSLRPEAKNNKNSKAAELILCSSCQLSCETFANALQACSRWTFSGRNLQSGLLIRAHNVVVVQSTVS